MVKFPKVIFNPIIPVSKPDIGILEYIHVFLAIKSSWISSRGKYIDLVESEISSFSRNKYSLLTSNGTVALHLALLSLDIKAGDEVIVPSLTYIATVNAIRYVGATPIFCEIEEETFNLDMEKLESLITNKTKAIIIVPIYGQPFNVQKVERIFENSKIFIVADCAEAPFADYNGRKLSEVAHVSTYSFYGNKIITSGEGGAISTNNTKIYEKIKLLKNQGMDPEKRYYFPIVGYNYRLSNILAAFLYAQLKRRKKMMRKRRSLYRMYESIFKEDARFTMQVKTEGNEVDPWSFPILIEKEYGSREKFMSFLEEHQIETRPFFIPIHLQPPYLEKPIRNLPITEDISKKGVNLPTSSSFSFLEKRKIKKIMKKLVRE
jgi:perosamine synthetase